MLLDTSAWIEYFKDTEKGKIVALILEKEQAFFTSLITISEVSVWCNKNKEDTAKFLQKLKNLSNLLELSETILLESGRIYSEQRNVNGKIGLIDCIIYTTAQIHGLVLLTKDNDFKGLQNIRTIDEYIGSHENN